MDFDCNNLNLRTIKVDKVTLGPEWRTDNFFPAWRIISYSRIYFPVSGEGAVVDGDQQFLLKPGVMMLIPPFANVQVSCSRSLCKYWMHFNALLPGTRTDIFFQSGRSMMIDTTGRNRDFTLLFDHLMTFEKQKQMRQIDHYEYNACLRLLVAPFLRILTESPSTAFMPRTIELLQYIDRNYYRKLTLNELASVACMHPNYLCSSFHRRMHMTVFEYIERVRMQHALEFFRLGNMTISEIAEKIGFSSIQAFSRNFRKIYGVSPRKYISMNSEIRNGILTGYLKASPSAD